MKIGDVSKRSGLAASKIRFYESAGLLPKQVRSGGKRDFSEAILIQLKVIRMAQDMGFKIREIKVLMAGISTRDSLSSRWKMLAKGKIEEIDHRIEQSQRMKILLERALHCNCLKMSDCAQVLEQ